MNEIENNDSSADRPSNEASATGQPARPLRKVRLLKDANLQQGLAFSEGEEVVVREVIEGKENEQSAYLIFSDKLQQVIKVPISLVEPATKPSPTVSPH